MALAGRLLGIPELYAVAVVALALVGGAAGLRAAPSLPDRGPTASCGRPRSTPTAAAGSSCRCATSTAAAPRCCRPATPSTAAGAGPGSSSRRSLPGETVRAAYRLPTGERGIFPLGPLQIGLTDPFGLAQRATEAAPVATLTVYPRIDEVRPLPAGPRHRADRLDRAGPPSPPAARTSTPCAPTRPATTCAGSTGPSTARHDELMIRQDEMPWQGRVTVLADLRSSRAHPRVARAGPVGRRPASSTPAGATTARSAWWPPTAPTPGSAPATPTRRPSSRYLAAADAARRRHLLLRPCWRPSTGTAPAGASPWCRPTGWPTRTWSASAGSSPRFGSVVLVVIERSAWDPARRPASPPAAAGRAPGGPGHRRRPTSPRVGQRRRRSTGRLDPRPRSASGERPDPPGRTRAAPGRRPGRAGRRPARRPAGPGRRRADGGRPGSGGPGGRGRPAPSSGPGRPRPAVELGRPTCKPTASATIALTVLTLAAVVQPRPAVRRPGSYVGPVVTTAVVMHAVAWGCRRQGLRPASAVAGVAGVPRPARLLAGAARDDPLRPAADRHAARRPARPSATPAPTSTPSWPRRRSRRGFLLGHRRRGRGPGPARRLGRLPDAGHARGGRPVLHPVRVRRRPRRPSAPHRLGRRRAGRPPRLRGRPRGDRQPGELGVVRQPDPGRAVVGRPGRRRCSARSPCWSAWSLGPAAARAPAPGR